MKTNQKGFSAVEVLIIVVIVGLIGAVGWLVFDSQNNQSSDSSTSTEQNQQKTEENTQQANTSPATLEKGTYGDSGEYGTFQAKGYVTLKTEKDPDNICGETCKERTLVYLNVTATENATAQKFINSTILVGCKEAEIINYISASTDGSNYTSYSHTVSDSQKILGSAINNEVTVEFNKIKYTGAGSEAPACYTDTITKLV